MPIPLTYVGYPGFLRSFLSKLRRTLVPIEDQWTWTTLDGEFFEEVEVESIEEDEVVFRHKFGEARLPIARLSEDSRLKLEQGFQPAEHPAGDELNAESGQGKASKEIVFQAASGRKGPGHSGVPGIAHN
ncbi:MAG: hypothetical protein LV480_08565 [Methylacidiphilales bacterium]|nr:hypothetical protein [Candidatus Methylacidiphilales bacterium]